MPVGCSVQRIRTHLLACLPAYLLLLPPAGTCLVLAGYMGQRAWQSSKVFPSGVVALVSAVMSIGYVRSLWS